MNALQQLHQLGQSIWYDNVERGLIESGEMAKLISQGVRGVTSNPTIFEKAILGGHHYDEAIAEAVRKNFTLDELYDDLVFHDILAVAKLLRPVYDESKGEDGYVSLEVSPRLAQDQEGTVKEALRLWRALQQPNLMIKVPATDAGIGAVQELIREGVNVNVTLIFGLHQYAQVLEAYIRGLEARHQAGQSLHVASVASFFVSRVDTHVDHQLQEKGNQELQGKAAVANAQLAYQHFMKVSQSDRWKKLSDAGAQPQRPLWASTSTKNPSYSPLLYVETLVGPQTVNTVPPVTLEHILKAEQFSRTVDADLSNAEKTVHDLRAIGLDLEEVGKVLLREGLDSFSKSFTTLWDALQKRIDEAKK
ncbi:transaldolase [Alicyclobacillus tolerans]|uniref:Transaldolase n=1 Tax=Alicyclobacillus tolerans TaxID=90970 RepID=A0A1M6N1R4_9BACL|nr:transaldolase [Alicyclobacillus montanus]SHJ89573.1 transaldolase [Alicyclobacillus montanus]